MLAGHQFAVADPQNDAGGIVPVARQSDRVGVAAAHDFDRLRLLELIQPLERVAHLRRALVVLRVAGLLHSFPQSRPHLECLAGEKQQHVVDHPAIVFRALIADARCLTAFDFHIERCKAPCVGYQSAEDYRRMIDDVLLFLSGKTLEVRARLRERMQEASNAQDYERAAQVRDALKWLDQLEQPQTVEVVGGGDADGIGLARDGDDAAGVILRIRDGKLVAREHRFLEHVEHAPEGEVLRTFIVGYYLPLEQRAQRVVLPFAPADFDALRELAPGVEFAVPQRGSAAKLVELGDQNARHLLDSFKIESFDIDERAADPVFALGRDLGLPVVPRAMVCIDISTNQGRDTVGSLVWFEGGRPRKAEYRRYRIKGVEGIDDFAAMKEVVSRFLTRRIAENKQIPDLIVIDGGKGQLAAAVEAARAQGQEGLPIVSLAKREEEVFLPGHGEPLRLSRRSPALKVLQRARDEAHRFAVTYSRKRRSQRTITSELLRIPGIGPARRRLLLERFGSLAGVRTATPAEISALPGFSTTLADRILDRLHQRA